jgi:hypothetical protein
VVPAISVSTAISHTNCFVIKIFKPIESLRLLHIILLHLAVLNPNHQKNFDVKNINPSSTTISEKWSSAKPKRQKIE